jgi:hypothetical protein
MARIAGIRFIGMCFKIKRFVREGTAWSGKLPKIHKKSKCGYTVKHTRILPFTHGYSFPVRTLVHIDKFQS